MAAFGLMGHRKDLLEKSQYRVFLRMNLLVFLHGHFEACDNQKQAECVHHPLEAMENRHTRPDKNRTHDERTENAPEKDLVLVLGRNVKITEHDEKHEDVVDRQRVFDDVTGEKKHAVFRAARHIDTEVEQKRQKNPQTAPSERFLKTHRVSFAMKNAQIERHQHGNDRSENH